MKANTYDYDYYDNYDDYDDEEEEEKDYAHYDYYDYNDYIMTMTMMTIIIFFNKKATRLDQSHKATPRKFSKQTRILLSPSPTCVHPA